MATGNTIKFNSKAFHMILASSGTRSVVNATAGRIRHAAGFDAYVRTMYGGYGGGRIVAFVGTTAKTPEEAELQREQLESATMGA